MNPLPTLTPPARAPRHAANVRRRRWRWIAAAVVLPVVIGALGLWWFVFRAFPPAAVRLDQALSGVGSSTPTAAGTVEGTWAIDRTITNAEGSGTFAGFRIDERLVGIGATTAVGRTPTVLGSLTVSGTTLQAATVTADLTHVTTNDSRRDDAVQRALATSRYPTATFVLTSPVSVGTVPEEGQRIELKAAGDLTIRGVTNNVAVAFEAQLQSGVLVVIGSSQILLSDYGVTAPTAPVVASVADTATMEFQLYFTRT